MSYEPAYECFEVTGPQGRTQRVEFKKAGFLAAGEQPELFFFLVDAREVVVGVSGEALRQWQQSRRYLSREEKIDVAGLFLRQQIVAGAALVSQNLLVGPVELQRLLRELGFLL